MKVVLALACLLSFGSARDYSSADDAEWENYKSKYGKNYGGSGSELDGVRKVIYFRTKKIIQDHNELYEKGQTSYTMGIKEFTDHLPEELGMMFGSKGTYIPQEPQGEMYRSLRSSLPDSVDWRTKNAVTPVKHQGSYCLSCYAYAATGSLEGQLALRKGKLISLSEQQLVDCSDEFGNNGCNGGWMHHSYAYIREHGGIESDATYPYTGEKGPCTFNKSNVVATVTGYVYIEPGFEADLQNAVALVGPIAAVIYTSDTFNDYTYTGGVYDDPACSTSNHTHAVLVVGYGTEDGKDYWLVKNSYGTDWGENGYIKMSRNKNNQCGIASEAIFPHVL